MNMHDVSDAWSPMSFTKQSASVSNCFGPLYTDYGMQKDFIEHIE